MQLICALLVLIAVAVPAAAQEILTLTTPEEQIIATTWQVRAINIDADAPSIEVTLKSDTGRVFVWRYVREFGLTPPPGAPTNAEILNAIQFINNGGYVAQGKTLRQWVLERIVALKIKVGTVTP
jgi:hypothetical protein